MGQGEDDRQAGVEKQGIRKESGKYPGIGVLGIHTYLASALPASRRVTWPVRLRPSWD